MNSVAAAGADSAAIAKIDRNNALIIAGSAQKTHRLRAMAILSHLRVRYLIAPKLPDRNALKSVPRDYACALVG